MITFTTDKYFKMPDTSQKGLIFVASLNKFYKVYTHGPCRVYLFHTQMCTILHIVKFEEMQSKHK